MIVYLIGFMGSGKSTAGRKIASALNWDFIDLDKEIERSTGRLIHEIFADEGEEYFRKTESNILMSLSSLSNTVVSCGGGTPCYKTNMDFMLGNGLTVYLKMEAEQLKSRLVNSQSIRPLIQNVDKEDLVSYIKNSLDEREKWYNRAEVVVNGMDLDIDSLKETILKKLIP
jgi:shikimate kinase